MARNLLFAGGLIALCLVAGCSASLTEKQDVQDFANELNLKVAKVRDTVPPALYSSMEQIIFSINSMAGVWYEIDQWGDQQSRWDLLTQLANSAVEYILQVLPSVPTTGKPPLEWGSQNPHADLESVAVSICEEFPGLQAYAEDTYGVSLALTSMTGCADATTISAFDMEMATPTVAGAPVPAPARRLLAV